MTWRQSRFKYWKRGGNKYGAKRTECLSGHWHNSGLESRVCDELRMRRDAGDIKDYEIEKTIRLELEGVKLGTYRVDFVVRHLDGSIEYVEAKGIPLPAWKQKWAILIGMNRNDPTVKFRVVTR